MFKFCIISIYFFCHCHTIFYARWKRNVEYHMSLLFNNIGTVILQKALVQHIFSFVIIDSIWYK